jgi:hypothetical protein
MTQLTTTFPEGSPTKKGTDAKKLQISESEDVKVLPKHLHSVSPN